MASTNFQKTLDSLLPTPPIENLNTHFVLGEIIDQIDLIKDEFPLVQIPLLKLHLWEIRNKNVDPEDHLRGFLKVFQDTKVFKNAFAQLDDGMKARITAFIKGGSEKDVMAKGGEFILPPSPPVKHHFGNMVEEIREKLEEDLLEVKDKVHGLLHPHHQDHKPVVADQVVGKGEPSTDGFPKIFENKEQTMVMEVRAELLLSLHVLYQSESNK
jgi:hypothetical protein